MEPNQVYPSELSAAQWAVLALEIVGKPPDQVGFVAQPRRRAVERIFAWLGPYRRPSKDNETNIRLV